MSLDKELQSKKSELTEFVDLTKRILNYLPEVISSSKDKGNYTIFLSQQAGTTKFVRPINKNLFIQNPDDFDRSFKAFKEVVSVKLRSSSPPVFSEEEHNTVNNTLYTIQQSIGAGLDLLVNSNSARKHVGNRFEELLKCVFDLAGISNKKTVLQIPYQTDEGTKVYKCENDLILSPYTVVKSSGSSLDPNEIVVSIKTTSKDRMGKIFIDKMLLERFVGHSQKVIGIFLNDVQRKESDNISYTLVSGLFMVYSSFLTELEGIYYLDPPANALKEPYNKYMKRFSSLLLNDFKELLSS
ncbi:MAG: hypothetical protein RIF33_13365 [Cyclobacteriaceae bacterium]